jgi:hypothetical protein
MLFDDRERKIVAKLLDKATPESEAAVASVALGKSWRNRGATLEELTANGSQPPPASSMMSVNWGAYKWPEHWGKYRGEMLIDIAEKDLAYLLSMQDWLKRLGAFRNPANDQLSTALAHFLQSR